jgi:RNA polymerase sigma-70 factor (ECF subfamily)
VRRTLATLPPAQQDVVRLRHVEGLRFREIAARLGRPLGTVLTQMRAALERMAAALEEYR